MRFQLESSNSRCLCYLPRQQCALATPVAMKELGSQLRHCYSSEQWGSCLGTWLGWQALPCDMHYRSAFNRIC